MFFNNDYFKKNFLVKIIFCIVSIVTALEIFSAPLSSTFPYKNTSPTGESLVNDYSKLNPIFTHLVLQPETLEEISYVMASTDRKVSIGGARYSQGGQIAFEESIHIDMRKFNNVLSLNDHEITVQTGITWREIQEYIDPFNLSVHTMQSYNNFTVGGSLSVNAHGRYLGHGGLISSVKAIKIVLADGSIVTATPTSNKEIFYSAIGGYGGLGVIVEATLKLEDNKKIKQDTKKINIKDFRKYFLDKVKNNDSIIFHNADIYPLNFENVLITNWSLTNSALTIDERLRDKNHRIPESLNICSTDINKCRIIMEKRLEQLNNEEGHVVWRNWESSFNTSELELNTNPDVVFLLKEYFVPEDQFDTFYLQLRDILKQHKVDFVNISIRHSPKDPDSILSWAKEDTFSFVIYFRQKTDLESQEYMKHWDSKIIDAAIEAGGSFYLPYKINASISQFEKAYPKYKEYYKIKEKLDPQHRFMNKLLETYFYNSN